MNWISEWFSVIISRQRHIMLVLIILKREHWSTQLSQSSVLCKNYQNNPANEYIHNNRISNAISFVNMNYTLNHCILQYIISWWLSNGKACLCSPISLNNRLTSWYKQSANKHSYEGFMEKGIFENSVQGKYKQITDIF